MYIFQKFFWVDTSRPSFCATTGIGPIPQKSWLRDWAQLPRGVTGSLHMCVVCGHKIIEYPCVYSLAKSYAKNTTKRVECHQHHQLITVQLVD